MRARQEPQTHFAQECFIDEVAAHAGIDPIALRLKYLTDEREIAVCARRPATDVVPTA